MNFANAKVSTWANIYCKIDSTIPRLICGEMVSIVVIADTLSGGNKTCGDDKFGYCWTEYNFSTSVVKTLLELHY